MLIYVIVAVASYFLGSIPFGYILVRLFRGEDVRATGSGNIGATNVMRSGSKGLGIATLIRLH
jgi:acyl phosphate:glycerol-3-phosphate acyltransferase